MACDGNGTATWVFPRPFTRLPAVAAVAEASVPLVVVLTEVSAVRAVAVAWMWAAGAWHRQAGAVVHLTATASAVD
jgi:hypothetical protein